MKVVFSKILNVHCSMRDSNDILHLCNKTRQEQDSNHPLTQKKSHLSQLFLRIITASQKKILIHGDKFLLICSQWLNLILKFPCPHERGTGRQKTKQFFVQKCTRSYRRCGISIYYLLFYCIFFHHSHYRFNSILVPCSPLVYDYCDMYSSHEMF